MRIDDVCAKIIGEDEEVLKELVKLMKLKVSPVMKKCAIRVIAYTSKIGNY
jgi:hypothetical protein